MDDASKGARLIERSGVALGPRAASELVDRMEQFGIDEIDDMIKVADRLDDALPCRIVGGIGGNGLLRDFFLATKPPCDVTQLATVFDSFSATARRMGVTRDIEVKDLLLSNARLAPPGLFIPREALESEIALATKIVAAKGDTFVGPWRRDLAGIDGFYSGRPAQLMTTASSDPYDVLRRAEEADRDVRRHGYHGASVFISAENVELQALLNHAAFGNYELVLDGGSVRSIDVLVENNQWVHIESGSIE